MDDTLDQEGDGVACFPDGLHRLLVAGVPEVHAAHLSEGHQGSPGPLLGEGNPAGKLTSTMRSPVFKVPFCPAGLSSRMCLMKMPLITSPLFSLLPIPRPPTMLMPRDFPGSRKSSTLKGGTTVYTRG